MPTEPAPAVEVIESTSPEILEEGQTRTDQPFVQEDDNTADAGDTAVAVAYAQEEDMPSTPAENIEEVFEESIGDEEIAVINELQVSVGNGENPNSPEIIGAAQQPANSQSPDIETEYPDTYQSDASSSLAGQIYLWIAFFAALAIFTAAVLGAILIYTRRRSKE